MIDGNTTALNQHQREIDDASDSELALEKAKQEFSNDLFDGYFTRNYAVIDEVEGMITNCTDTMDNLLRKLRDNFETDQVQLQYREFISKVCDELAYDCDSLDDVERDRRVYGL